MEECICYQRSYSVGFKWFWPLLEKNSTIHCPIPQEVQPLNSQVMDFLQSLPPVMETSYFGPRSQMPIGYHICGSLNNVRG